MVPRRGVRGAVGRPASRGSGAVAGAEYGYISELCSYARTHLGCAVLTQQHRRTSVRPGVVGLAGPGGAREQLPEPDFFVNAYAGCSTGSAVGRDHLADLRQEDADLQRRPSVPVGQQARLPATCAGEEWEEVAQVRRQASCAN